MKKGSVITYLDDSAKVGKQHVQSLNTAPYVILNKDLENFTSHNGNIATTWCGRWRKSYECISFNVRKTLSRIKTRDNIVKTQRWRRCSQRASTDRFRCGVSHSYQRREHKTKNRNLSHKIKSSRCTRPERLVPQEIEQSWTFISACLKYPSRTLSIASLDERFIF